jgi:hypothetical protein
MIRHGSRNEIAKIGAFSKHRGPAPFGTGPRHLQLLHQPVEAGVAQF